MNTFIGKTVVVTGGCGGLGSEMVRAFAAEGATVIIADVDSDKGSALVREIGPNARFIPIDVSDESDWESLLITVNAELGGLDVLVNNAGFFQPNVEFENMPLELWRKHFAINADGVFLGCKHGIRCMKSRGGTIINIGSGMSIKANPTASAYCGSKAAVLMTTRTAAAAAGKYGIRVNAVLPGAVETAMLLGNLMPGEEKADYLKRLALFGALGHLATPADIARGVLFLASPHSLSITGVALPIDGGNFLGS